MKKYTDSDIQRAKELRIKERYSFAQLQKLTGIPATTIRNWCVDISTGTKWDTLIATQERKRTEIKNSELQVTQQLKTLSPSQAKLYVALLYWCEGSKYPGTNKVFFTNSDPLLMKTFVSLLRKAFPLDESKFRLHLQIHDTHDYKQLQNFWGNLLHIPPSQFIKPTITTPKNGKHRYIYNGTCTVRYFDFRVQLKIMGIYETFAKIIAIE